MSEHISIITPPLNSTNNDIIIGERTISFMASQSKLDDEAKANIIDEALDILSHCIPPGVHDEITNIAVGYVQSGKTLSFTTLTALAADNGYRIIIYLTGTKTNLQKQTARRLRKDLLVGSRDKTYKVFTGKLSAKASDINDVKNFLKLENMTLLFPILKHYQHISDLAELFSSVSLKDLIASKGVIIIDDEADQSSFNTYAKKNADRVSEGDWTEDEFSRTYASIMKLKKAFPSHSYIQYTATPQAAFLISNDDILSPKYHTVLTPGDEYTGGKFFFKNSDMDLVKEIPEAEVYHYSRNPLEDVPETLLESLRQFFISVAIVVAIQEREPYLSMLVHADGLKITNEKFHNWVTGMRQLWIDTLNGASHDIGRMSLVKSFKKSYAEIIRYVENPPSFEDVLNDLVYVMVQTKIHLVQSSTETADLSVQNDIDWDEDLAHILIGADMLNRGFTVEKLSMTYMPRCSKGRATADTIEQRCRFFGYRKNYIDVCRLFLPAKSIQEYNDYVDHEETLRATLKQCKSLSEMTLHSMKIANTLNPTRTNILSSKLIRNKLYGWRQLVSTDNIAKNHNTIDEFIQSMSDKWIYDVDYHNPMRNHRYVEIPIDDFLDFFKKIKYQDVPNFTRKIVTIQYLSYIKETKGIDTVRVYQISFAAGPRKRKMINGKIQELFAGFTQDGAYPGDKHFHSNNIVSVQIHRNIVDSLAIDLVNKDFYNLAIYYPERSDFVTIEDSADDEEP